MRLLQAILLFSVTGFMAQGLVAEDASGPGVPSDVAIAGEQEVFLPPLPRWREGGTPYDPDQSLRPYAIEFEGVREAPTSGLIASPPEYDPVRDVIFCYVQGQWNSVVRDLVVALTDDPLHDERAIVVVPSAYHQSMATSAFVAGGADMSKVEFIIELVNALWIRDYGPHFIWQGAALGLADSHYYPTRPADNFIPTLLGDDHLLMPTYDMGVYYSGGNFLPGPNRTAFMSSLINLDNPGWAGFSEAFIAELFNQYQGIDTLHIMPQLPWSVDGTGHIDMWMYLVDEDSVIISEFKPGSNPTAIQITDDAVPYMEDLGFEVFRPWAWNVGSTHFTYANSFRVNDRIFIPKYASYPSENADALAKYQAAAGPEVEIIQIESQSIIPAAGALHCIVMQLPRCTDAIPAVHVISPAGGELLVSGTTHTIAWTATDTDNETIPQIDLYYSTDDGGTYEFIATTTDTGYYDWTVPEVVTTVARVKVVATSADSDQGQGVSAAVFEIAAAEQTVYDFASGAGVDKFGYGYQTSSWNYSVDGERTPVGSEIDSLVSGAYGKLAFSDATGGDYDSNRYISPTPTGGNESTHIFEFTIDEDPAVISDVGLLWEGYADQCAQAELYVWDYVAQQWSDGAGLAGQNRFVDNWAGNRDGTLSGHVRADFDRYIDASGQMTLLLYAERNGNETFHDYMAVTVTTSGLLGDLNCDGVVNGFDIDPFVLALTSAPTFEDYYAEYPDCDHMLADCNGDGAVDAFDIDPFVDILTS